MRHREEIMIGCLLFYGLYPLTRYFRNKASEPSKKDLSSALVNGTVWNGGSVSTRRYTETETALLDQRLSTSSGPRAQTGERLNDQVPRKDEEKKADMKDGEQRRAVPCDEETNKDPVSENGEVQSAEKEEEAHMSDGEQKLQVEAHKPDDLKTTIYHTELNKGEEATFKPAETIRPEQELWAKLQNQLVEHGNLEATCPTEQQPHMPTMEESITPARARVAEIECWDENLIVDTDEMQAGTHSAGLDLVSLLSEAQSPPDESQAQSSQAGWHIPAGPGLTELVHCPSWQFPTMSYYPSLEQTTPFEVVWRVWEEENESPIAAKPDSQVLFDFTVMSYNILAQDLLEANQELYTHCPLEVLEWTYRYYQVIEEILKWGPDILCLQEVQENHYREQLRPALFEMGYTCVYKRRTRAKTDGCAICYRGDRFSQLSVSMLEFFRPETELLDRDNVGIVLLLQPIVTQGSEVTAKGPPLCVANTHLLFNPGRGDVKLAQLAIMLAEIDHMVKSCRATRELCNIVLCGDFNSVPHMPLYQFITTGQLYYHGLPAWMVSGQENMSYKIHQRRLFTPLWSSSLCITNTCQYTSDQETETSERHVQKPGKLQYNHSFLRQLRFCPAACVRPLDLDLIPGVTDNTPDPSWENRAFDPRFRNTICHGLNLCSAYKHTLQGSERSEVTTLHSEVGATVDYIFYTPTCDVSSDGQIGDCCPTSGGLKLIGRLSLLSEEDLWAMKGLPNEIFPSDHLSLLARFQLELSPV